MKVRFIVFLGVAFSCLLTYGLQADSVILIDTKAERLKNTPDTYPLQKSQNVSFKNPTLRTFMDADSLDYDEKTQTIFARGNVEITRGNLTLFADKVSFNQRTNEIQASGNVRLRDQDGNLLFSDDFTLKGDLKTGAAEAVKGIMADDAIFAANRIRRDSESTSQFDQVIYTPCKLCRKNPDENPTWSIQSRYMIIDHESGDIEHTDSFLQILGKKVAYLPYVSHPGPTVKRRSGFLSPIAGGSGNLGAIFGFSYFWAINQQSDLTITPIYTRENPLLLMQYRHAFCGGEFNIELSGTKSRFQAGPAAAPVEKNEFRGHLRTHGRFRVDLPIFDDSFFGFDINRTLDDTYLKKYTILGLSKESYLTSRVYYEGFKDRNYFLVEGLNFQGLQQDDASGSIPFIIPSIEYKYLSKPVAYQLTPYFDTSFLNLQRRQGQNVKRLIFLAGLKRQWVSSYGTIADIGLETKFWHYRLSNTTLPLTDGEFARVSPRAYAHIRYPLYRQFSAGRMVVEPIVGMVLTASNQNGMPFPDEDSFAELSDANIFDADRFSGHDFVDNFSRINYGLKLAFFSKSLGNSQLFIGQSVSLTNLGLNTSQNFDSAGIRQGTSDFVIRGQYTYKDWFQVLSRMVINRDTFTSTRNESNMYIGQPVFRVKFGYNKFPRPNALGQSIEQMRYGFSTQITSNWSLETDFSRELGNQGGALSHGASLIYKDDCFQFSTSVYRTFYEDRDFKPGLTVMFRLSFKNLGDIELTPNRLGLGEALRE